MSKHSLLYGSKTWTFTKKKKERQIQSSEITFLKCVKECSIIDKISNGYIRRKLEIMPVLKREKKKSTEGNENTSQKGWILITYQNSLKISSKMKKRQKNTKKDTDSKKNRLIDLNHVWNNGDKSRKLVNIIYR